MAFGEWLTRKRLELSARKGSRITQAAIAEAASISRPYYGFLESGVHPTAGKLLDRELVVRLARALQADEQEALLAAGFGEQLSEDERELLRRFRSMDPAQSQAFRRLLETVVPNWPPVSA